ncbi:flagellin [Methanocaldococcus jannaschii]|uniref:Flagellin B3 n=1 Tax=Methanocaldococcus jannaschii (strain ATCC 43067 / DSM 2661 / JAL-1 / JCM 10045 / NBRC 100440) TaxID=243232 RepID=FLAB3_METJA|nr:flagellin [Methanocaldococcus jannaschii]Q58303.1 RecName: Full=Flagellin B3; Flags: Precursor [Methanocaldococcus jannaschii DSM 2661]
MLLDYIKSRRGAIGIGTLIIFIALVLVAAVAAAVIINTAANLQHKAARVGEESTRQVASGIQVLKITGYAVNTKNITKLAILVSPNVGDEIDLSSTIVTISNGDYKASLVYGGQITYVNTNGTRDIFNESWPNIANPTTEFGVIVLQDADGSMNNTEHPTMNFGDKAIIAINVGDVFGGIMPRERIYGEVIPEFGASGIIEFRAPSTFSEHVVTLQ